MAKLKVRITDVPTGKIRLRTYIGELAALERLRQDILKDRAGYHPPGTAIHTPIPPGVKPKSMVPSFLVRDPIEIEPD